MEKFLFGEIYLSNIEEDFFYHYHRKFVTITLWIIYFFVDTFSLNIIIWLYAKLCFSLSEIKIIKRLSLNRSSFLRIYFNYSILVSSKMNLWNHCGNRRLIIFFDIRKNEYVNVNKWKDKNNIRRYLFIFQYIYYVFI